MSTSTPAPKPHYVLIVEENVHHAELLTEVLDRHFAPVVIHTVDTFADGMEFMSQSTYDLILTAAHVDDDNIKDYLPDLLSLAGGTPMIVITGSGDERLATKLIKKGVADYVAKTREALEKLPKIIGKHLGKAKRGKSVKHPVTLVRDKLPKSRNLAREIRRFKELAARLPGDRPLPANLRKAPSEEEIAKLVEQLEHVRSLMQNS